jgi:carbamoyltransferase
MKIVLGISCYYHDSAAVIIIDGKIVFAAQEERFTRIKHDSSFPFFAIKESLKYCCLNLDDIDAIVFYEKPFIKFERLIETYLKNAPFGIFSFLMSMPIWIKEKFFQKKVIYNSLKHIDKKFSYENKIHFCDHHLSHAASAFFPSKFKNAIILTVDGVGEWTTTSVYKGTDNNLEKIKEIHFPDSIGLLYSAFTYFLGFKVNSGEYKLMGLAPYGKPVYKDLIYSNLIKIYSDKSFELNQKYFNYQTGLTMTNSNFNKLFEISPRKENQKIEEKHMDIAASIQEVTEELMINITSTLYNDYKIDNLCLAGGVALNCVANGKIVQSKNNFKNLWIQPAAGDAGGAIGAALAYWFSLGNNRREATNNEQDHMSGSFLGQSYTDKEVKKTLDSVKANYKRYPDEELFDVVAKYLSDGKAIGWFQGRMEFGPRALGNRSILADPRSEKMQKNLNLKVKFRESFRPFAPSIIEEDLDEWFDTNIPNSYMQLVSKVKESKLIKNSIQSKGFDQLNHKRSEVPAITHVDNSARVQTVNEKNNKKFYDLLKAFKKITNVPILVNTSFNIRGEPIVSSVEDAFRCFMGTNLDVLICENYVMLKNKNQNQKDANYKNKFSLD